MTPNPYTKTNVNSANDFDEVVKTFTTVINGLYHLENLLSGNPFNQSSITDNALKNLGYYEEFYSDVAGDLEVFRSVICGAELDWGRVTNND